MATIILSAVGASVGASIGGSVLGISAAALGRAAGATIGRVIDQRILGSGSPAIEVGKIDRFRLTGASEGAPIAQVHGRIRVAGQVIWASHFKEKSSTSGGGGKGGPSQPETTTYSYCISLAIALCEGTITRVGRVWADGMEIAASDLNMRVYHGTETQMPDPTMEAIEGIGQVPAYRGTAYVVFEDLALGQFGNRVPQFTFEVVRTGDGDPAEHVRAVALVPGTGEYALATTPVHFEDAPGVVRTANVNTGSDEADILTSLDALTEEAPNCRATSLIVSWFGTDLRCGSCDIAPRVEQTDVDGTGMPWEVSGISRENAGLVPLLDGRPVYGGTPADASVVEAIQALKTAGQDVMFYPFILMQQLAGNGLTDPWTGSGEQPHLPWRGRITTSLAPGVSGTSDGTAAATNEVEAFFGDCAPGDFVTDGTRVIYTGSDGFSYRRFILHYAHLCAAAGGVESFCIGSEMRSLTQIRGNAGSYPAVDELIALAVDVRTILGPNTKIGYAADWSEYFGHHPQDGSGDVVFHLDDLWASADIDFIGIDNYMPLSDWRDGDDHADVDWGSIYNPDYLKANIAGGEGYDWYYASQADADDQVRSPITDGTHGEPWVYRYKDLVNWWTQPHHDRIGGVRQATATAWVPGSKPIWFTEFGCAAIDKGANQPNKFLDPKSSESSLPKYSNGARDDLMQMQYLRAMAEYWDEGANNPAATLYTGRMVDTSRMFVWAWDARPYPNFPANLDVWSDGENYARGHWLSGRISTRALASVVAEICLRAGVTDFDVSELHGLVRGYEIAGDDTPRAALQPLLLANGVDVIEAGGKLIFRNRSLRVTGDLDADGVVETDAPGSFAQVRDPKADIPDVVRLNYIEADGSFAARTVESSFPDANVFGVATSELPLVLTRGESTAAADRWLSEMRVARDHVVFSVPPSSTLEAGDVVTVSSNEAVGTFRIDRLEDAGERLAEGVRVEPAIYETVAYAEESAGVQATVPSLPVWPVIMDLPLLTGDESPEAPWVAATGTPWPGEAAIYSASDGDGWVYQSSLSQSALIGLSQNDLPFAAPSIWDRGTAVTVRLNGASLSSVSRDSVLAGANVAVIGDPAANRWEVFQFRDAMLVGEDAWALSMRLRGQRGTDGVIPENWPAGSTVVVLTNAVQQLPFNASWRGIERQYRIGPARKAVDHASYTPLTHVGDAVGLRPYMPVHLRAHELGGDVYVSWKRQTRVDGDLWSLPDVPLGESSEAYVVTVTQAGNAVREETVSTPNWVYTATQRAADGLFGSFDIEIAQVSDRFGPGLAGKVTFDG
ncbi:MAG: glycoside hydrolase/phage tail family protein [Pseudomonadota bacterium]